MKAARIELPGVANVIETDPPTPAYNEVLIQVQSAGICGTDVHIFRGEYEADYPLTPGHEFSGIVTAVGKGVHDFKIGDRVTADPNIPCGRCEFCQRNQPNQCRNLAAIGVTRDGAFAEYVLAPEDNVFSIGNMPFTTATFVEPLACVIWGLKRVQVQPGDHALVFGAGPMGCLILQALQKSGTATVTVTDVAPRRLEIAEQLGATQVLIPSADQVRQLKDYSREGFDLVVDATGIPAVIEQGVYVTRPRGKLWIFGVTPKGAMVSLPSYEIFRKDLSIIGSFAVNRTFQESINLLESGAIRVEPLISHVLPLDDFAEGLEIAQHDPKRMKVQFGMS